jgi:NADH-quinone oxidoreductase subunit J
MDFLIENFGAIFFYVVAAITVAGAVGVITLRNPVHAAVSLLLTFVMVAVLFILKHAEFLAAVQVLVYAGGIMVLYLFVIMLVRVKNLRAEEVFLSGVAPLAVLGGILLGTLIAAGILLGSMAAGDASADVMRTVVTEGGSEVVGNTEAVGWVLYMKYLVPFEIISVLLLVAMIGAIVFGRRDAALVERGEGVEL